MPGIGCALHSHPRQTCHHDRPRSRNDRAIRLMNARVNRSLVIECLRELTDEQFQTTVWAGKDPTRMASFVECLEGLFDDSGLDDAHAIGPIFGDYIDNQLKALDVLLLKINDRVSIQDLLANPDLGRARLVAADIVTALDAQDPT